MMEVNKDLAKQELYRRGILRWKCHKIQREMYDLFYKAEENTTLVWLLGRQSGKSFLLAVLAIETALRKSNSIIKLVTDTKLHLHSIFEPLFKEILMDCPEELKPHYNKQKYVYEFPNGSSVQLAGSDGKHYEKLRGQKSSLVLIDEAGFCNDLADMIESVLLPTTTHTGGNLVLATTPPEESTHDFFKFMEEAEMSNNLIKKTIYDNPLLTKEKIEKIVAKMGGETNPRFRREYLCEIIRSNDTSVIPEFDEVLEKEIVRDWAKPQFYDSYEAMDLGGKDLTVVLFAYYDFKNDKLVIEDEITMDFQKSNNNLQTLTQAILKKEENIWLNIYTNELKKPTARVSDINYIALNEIRKYSNDQIQFTIAKKDDNVSAINHLRVLLGNKKIIIHPRCTTLIRHLKNVKWKSSHDKSVFSRSPDNGHYDAVDALKYLVRHVQFSKNPYPANFEYNTRDIHIQNPDKFNSNKQLEVFKKMFGIRKRK